MQYLRSGPGALACAKRKATSVTSEVARGSTMPRAPINSSLDHNPDTAQAFSAGAPAAGSVLSLGTTAKTAGSQGKSGSAPPAPPAPGPDWWADLEYVWRTRTAAARERLQLRAKSLGAMLRRKVVAVDRPPNDYGPRMQPRTTAWSPSFQVKLARSEEWADHRARAIALARQDVLATCDQRWRQVACGCTRVEMRVGCDQPQLCLKCRKRHSRKWHRRIVKGMDAALRDERAAFYNAPAYRRRGMRPGIYLITLTGPHSGDLVTDREVMGKAVRKLTDYARKAGWWSTYALTWEATAGTAGDGHLHCHIAVVSSWIPYTSDNTLQDGALAQCPRRRGERRDVRGLHEVWSDAMPGSIQPDVQAPRKGADEASSAGYYLAKYVTKGVDAAEFTGRKAGELLCALRGRRKVSTSRAFWRDEAPRCEECAAVWRLTGSPCALQDIAPGAVLRSMAERAGWWIPRGDVQIHLRASGADRPLASVLPSPSTRKPSRSRSTSH